MRIIQLTQPTWPGGAQLGLPTWEQDGLEPGFQVGSKWASPLIKKKNYLLMHFLNFDFCHFCAAFFPTISKQNE